MKMAITVVVIGIVVVCLAAFFFMTQYNGEAKPQKAPSVASEYTDRQDIKELLLKDSVSGDEKEMTERALDRLFKAEKHVMMEYVGRPQTETEREQREDDFIREHGVQIWVNMQVGTQELPIIFPIKAKGIYFDIKHLIDYERDGATYEYWVTQVAPQPWAGTYSTEIFTLIKQAEGDAPREIVYTANRFESTIEIDSVEPIELPVDDGRFVYEMNPQGWPAVYEGTALEGVDAVIGRDGEYLIRGK